MRWLRVPAVLLLAALLGGCWDGVEVERRAFILAVSLDRAPGGVRMGVEIVPPHLASGISGRFVQAAYVKEVTGATTIQAMDALHTAIDREPLYGHVQVILVGEALARGGIWRHIAPLLGNLRVPRTAWLAVVRGEAAPLLKLHPPLEHIPPPYVATLFENRSVFPSPATMTLGHFHELWTYPGVDPVAAWIEPPISGDRAPRIRGVAVFRGDRFVGTIALPEAHGWMLLQNQVPRTLLSVPCPRSRGALHIRLSDTRIRLRPRAAGGRLLSLSVTGRVVARAEGETCRDNLADPAIVSEAEAALRRELTGLVQRAIRRVRGREAADVFGFGRAVFRHANPVWNRIGDWYRAFVTAPVEVDLRVHLDTTWGFRSPMPAEGVEAAAPSGRGQAVPPAARSLPGVARRRALRAAGGGPPPSAPAPDSAARRWTR